MALTDYTLTDASVGQTIGPPNGFLVSLKMTTPPKHETPEGDDGSGIWRRGYLQLRGSGDVRDVYCATTGSVPGGFLIGNNSIPFKGDLIVRCVPRGGVFALTLSDLPNRRAPSL